MVQTYIYIYQYPGEAVVLDIAGSVKCAPRQSYKARADIIYSI